jgi:hypothetical protein
MESQSKVSSALAICFLEHRSVAGIDLGVSQGSISIKLRRSCRSCVPQQLIKFEEISMNNSALLISRRAEPIELHKCCQGEINTGLP